MWLRVLTFTLTLLLTGGANLASQQEPPIRLKTVVVNVPVVVYDKQTGVVYQNLQRENFQIYEDKVKQEIAYFTPIESSINLVILLENNRRLREINRGDYQPLMDDVIAAASTFIGRFVTREDNVAVVSFSARPKVVTDFTNNIGQLRQSVVEVARDSVTLSESNLLDALLFALVGGRDHEGDEYKGLVEVEGRTGVLLVATGFDTFSRARMGDALRTIERAGVPVYTIGIGNLRYKRIEPYLSSSDRLSYLQAFNLLRSIAESSGGRYYPVTFETQMPGTLDAVSALMRNKYSLGYTPSNARTEGKRRRIEILVDVDGDGQPDNDRLVVQYRRNYREPGKGEDWSPRPQHFTTRIGGQTQIILGNL